MADKYLSDELFEAIDNLVDAKIELKEQSDLHSKGYPEPTSAREKVEECRKALRGAIISLSWLASSK